MNPNKDTLDAWDDDWIDRQPKEALNVQEQSRQAKKLTKAERRRQQLEFNKKLWEDAEIPDTPYLVQKNNDVPLQSGFTPNIKVLSRRPVAGDSIVNTQHDDENGEEEELTTGRMTSEQRAEKLRREREDKQRKYDEVRQKIFGQSGDAGTTSSTMTSDIRSRTSINTSNSAVERSRGRGRGGSSARGSPSRQLYDPNSARGGSRSSSGRNTPIDFVPIRSPKGPDGSGRGGRGFVNRGGRGM